MLRPGTFALTLLLSLLTGLGPLSMDMYLPSLPAIGEALHASTAQVQLTISSYLLGFAVGQILYGPISDRFGRRPVIVSGCFTSASGLILLALLPGLGGYFAALAVLGLGSGLLDVGPAAMLGDILKDQSGTVVATYQMAGDIGAVAGPVTAGYLVDAASYGAAFTVAAGVLGLAAVLGLFAPETRWRDRPIDPGLLAGRPS